MSVGNDEDFRAGARRRRSWTRDEKRRIVEESLQEGASIAGVAQRHALNANLLFTWRRKMGVEPSGQKDPPPILPVTIIAEADEARPDSSGQMAIVLCEGERIIVWSDVEPAALARVLKVLSRR